MTNDKYPTREQWLIALDAKLDEIFVRAGRRLKPKMRMSCGFPSTRARINPTGSYRIGECWHAEASKDGTHEIFISPTLDDPFQVAETLIHERVHAYQEAGTGHKAPFARLARAVGLEGKPTRTELSAQLRKRIEPILEELGPYPHAAVDTGGRKKQGTRLIKVVCPQCGMVIRTTTMWLTMIGPPTCGCGGQMEIGDLDEEGINLRTVEQMIVFAIDDPRFEIRFARNKGARDGKWYIVDFEATLPSGEVTTKMTMCEDRMDCIETIDAIREGLYQYKVEEERMDDYEDEDDFVPDDEYEILDYPDDAEDDVDEYPENQEDEPPSIITAAPEADDFDMEATVREHRERMRDEAQGWEKS